MNAAPFNCTFKTFGVVVTATNKVTTIKLIFLLLTKHCMHANIIILLLSNDYSNALKHLVAIKPAGMLMLCLASCKSILAWETSLLFHSQIELDLSSGLWKRKVCMLSHQLNKPTHETLKKSECSFCLVTNSKKNQHLKLDVSPQCVCCVYVHTSVCFFTHLQDFYVSLSSFDVESSQKLTRT